MSMPYVIFSKIKHESEALEEINSIIWHQVKNSRENPIGFNDLVLWINETNGYVSCHYYNSADQIIDESDFYSAVEFPDLREEITERAVMNDRQPTVYLNQHQAI